MAMFPPLMRNQYCDMFNRTCRDRSVLLIECDVASAEFALVLGLQQLHIAFENIDSFSIPLQTI